MSNNSNVENHIGPQAGNFGTRHYAQRHAGALTL